AECGFAGPVFPVNPGADGPILGHRAYQRVEDVEDEIDVALIMRNTSGSLEALRSVVDMGVRAAILFNGVVERYEEYNEAVRSVLAGGQTRVIGPTSLGVFNLVDDVPLTYAYLESERSAP